jgi:hypothetical protein
MRVETFTEIYPPLVANQLVQGAAPERLQRVWDMATPESFRPPSGG